MADDVGAEPAAAARTAAALLPEVANAEAPDSDDRRQDRLAFNLVALPVLIGMPIWCFVKVGAAPWGWALDLAGLPVWLLVRAAFFAMRGSETGIVTVGGDGVIRLRTGHVAVRRLRRLFDVGSGRWLGQSIVGGLLLFAVGMAAFVVPAVAFDLPELMLVFLSASGFACLDLVRWYFVVMHHRRSKDQRLVDGHQILPSLALYGRVHGWSAVRAGVPADRLAATLAAHPEQLRVVREYSVGAEALAGLARRSGWV